MPDVNYDELKEQIEDELGNSVFNMVPSDVRILLSEKLMLLSVDDV
ncbi:MULTISPECIES: hypothetical protein [Brenneria]|nr:MULTISPECIES: hypothetical protein [Brenneria]EHD22066.1 hypothetical protein BrE312_2689 [Brenneria sp. EniD312]